MEKQKLISHKSRNMYNIMLCLLFYVDAVFHLRINLLYYTNKFERKKKLKKIGRLLLNESPSYLETIGRNFWAGNK